MDENCALVVLKSEQPKKLASCAAFERLGSEFGKLGREYGALVGRLGTDIADIR